MTVGKKTNIYSTGAGGIIAGGIIANQVKEYFKYTKMDTHNKVGIAPSACTYNSKNIDNLITVLGILKL